MKKIFLFVSLFFCLLSGSGQSLNLDSLKNLLLTAPRDTNRVNLLNLITGFYIWSSPDSAVMYSQEGIQLANTLNYDRGLERHMANMTAALTTLGNYSAALDFSYRAIPIAERLHDTLGIAFCYAGLAGSYVELGDYEKALNSAAVITNNYSSILADPVMAGVFEQLLASIYQRNNQLDSALYFAKLSIQHRPDWSGDLNVLAGTYARLGQDSLALEYYREAVPAAKRDSYQIDILDAYNGIARIYRKEGKFDSSIYYSKLALTQKWGKTYPVAIFQATQLLSEIYEKQNKNDSALKYLRLTISMKDSLFNQQKTREAQTLAFNNLLHKQELSVREKEHAGRVRILALLGALIVFLAIAFLLWRNNMHRKKAYDELQKQKQETDLQKIKAEDALKELKLTQNQLIQSEKMAALGELTAGIAHEIQNPLNFVNNFSEVNAELIREMKDELKKGNTKEVNAIADHVLENEDKISHHGKRADAIVKGMLQHSRADAGQKEPTDINALADEWLRLAYHGFRAKNKDFNVEMTTDFDPSISKQSIVQQDIGRVFLNLYNNAFYSVYEKLKIRGNSYQPKVSVSTKKTDNKILIRFHDKGVGIPEKIKDKIFQPFFTSKPAGEGTGLGLSLSYDIVKAHGGELLLVSKPNEGAEFIVELPLNA